MREELVDEIRAGLYLPDPLAVGLLSARMAGEPLRPLPEKAGHRRHARAPAPVAVELGDERGGMRDRVALALKAPSLAHESVEVDVACPPETRVAISDGLTRPRDAERLARP